MSLCPWWPEYDMMCAMLCHLQPFVDRVQGEMITLVVLYGRFLELFWSFTSMGDNVYV
jgi:hypothetical protein